MFKYNSNYWLKCFSLCGVILLPLSAMAATSGSFSIDLGNASPILINNILTGTMDQSVTGGSSGDSPAWISFSTNLKFNLPSTVKMEGVINGTITSTNINKGSTHTDSFSIDMSALANSWGPGVLLRWPESIGLLEPFQFTDHITLSGSITVTNSSTSPVVVSGRNFSFWAHGFNEWSVPISGTVPAKSVCTITISQPFLSLGEISFSQLSSAATGSRLDGMSGTENVVTQCTGATSVNLKITTTASVSYDNCAEGDNKSLNFCAESNGRKFNINGDPIKIDGDDFSSGHSTPVTFYAVKGKEPSIGVSSSTVSIVASPN